jgi:hypothetical protein
MNFHSTKIIKCTWLNLNSGLQVHNFVKAIYHEFKESITKNFYGLDIHIVHTIREQNENMMDFNSIKVFTCNGKYESWTQVHKILMPNYYKSKESIKNNVFGLGIHKVHRNHQKNCFWIGYT